MCELAKHITVPVTMDFMSVSSYGDGTSSSGVVKIVKDLDQPLEGRDVLIVEDIIDSGKTLSYLMEILQNRRPKSLRLCTLLDKPERRASCRGGLLWISDTGCVCSWLWAGLCAKISESAVYRSGRIFRHPRAVMTGLAASRSDC